MTMLRIGLLTSLFLIVATAWAEEPARYKVEVVLFENLDPTAMRAEHWPQTVTSPSLENAIELARPSARSGFLSLPDGAKELVTIAKLLDDSSQYRVLAHLAWEQPGLSSEAAKPVVLRSGKDYALEFPQLMQPRLEVDANGNVVEIQPPERLDELEGTLRVVLGRYLHVYSDLVFRKPTTSMVYDQTTETLLPVEQLQPVPVQEWRRMRSRELHYVDHPVLGMLVKITPVEASPQGTKNPA